MISFGLGRWEGLEGIGEEELKALRPKAERAVLGAAMLFSNAIKEKLSGSRSGRIYRIGKRGRTYQASAPGEAPATLTGKLRQSITFTQPVWDENGVVSAEVGSNLGSSAMLEYGGVTWNGGRILPRPYIASTFLEQEDAILAILEEATKG